MASWASTSRERDGEKAGAPALESQGRGGRAQEAATRAGKQREAAMAGENAMGAGKLGQREELARGRAPWEIQVSKRRGAEQLELGEKSCRVPATKEQGERRSPWKMVAMGELTMGRR